MKEFASKLIQYLKDNKESYLEVNEWCGDTEYGFYTETNFDMEALWKEIDEFCESFQQGQ